MRKAIFILMILAMALPAFAADDSDVTYTGGTAQQLKEGSAGKFDFTSAGELRFVAPGTVLEIPYKSIDSFQHTKEAAVHLGIAPAVAVALVAARRHNHYVRITWKDGSQLPQVAIFEIPKNMTSYLMPMLEARSPQAHCAPYEDCTPKPVTQRPPVPTTAAPAPQPAASK